MLYEVITSWYVYDSDVLYLYDLSTKIKHPITSDYYEYSHIYHHDIYNDRIVWVSDEITEGSNICMYDFSAQYYTGITSGSSENRLSIANPHIYGNRIVWEELDEQNIIMYDPSSKNETQITTSGSAHSPDIYSNRIVWVV